MKTVALFLCLATVAYCQQEPPPFLKNASPEKQREFEGIFANAGGLTDEQIDKKVQEWISKQSASIKSYV
uniref:DUF148 domain-containing protein n=1 Tax=Heterorhabditis bacteriophora TaxID=37862 RepID=A0A1I7XDX0_HETBA